VSGGPTGFRQRRDRVRASLGGPVQADRLLVTSLPNVRYLTGFSGSNGVVVVDVDPAADVFGTDGRYRDQADDQVPDLPRVVDRDTVSAVMAQVRAGGYAIESSMPVGVAHDLAARFAGQAIADDVVEGLRAVKDPQEVAILARACAITAEAFDALAAGIRVGDTELSLARRLEQLFGELGAEDRAFDSIIASGPNSAIPHHEPGSRALRRGDLVVIDAGARVAGYHADMTRTFLVAAEPTPWQAEVHALVRQAQQAAAQGARPLLTGREVDAFARDIIEAGGHGERFEHGLGHGVGLEIHEAPNLGVRSTGTLAPDMTITVEPGIYLLGRGGVRIEDTLVVTDVGPRILTEAPRDLTVVG
jgi:Xaa-Pro dipeptidase